jgi:twitching motility protein PilT
VVDAINARSRAHIITVEDPIEVVHVPKRAVVSQRQVGEHTQSFARALKGALREDPDVIVIGELRDRETVEIALTASETGHLVLATMSTRSAAKTVDRLIDLFPPDQQQQVRATLAGALKMVVSQRLVPTPQGTRLPAIEVMTGSVPLWTLIRENKLFQLPSLQQRGRAIGMVRLDASLEAMVRDGQVEAEVALSFAEERPELERRLRDAKPAPLPAGAFGGQKGPP